MEGFETKKLKAVLLSPLHIGSYQQALSQTEYFAGPGRIYLADPDKVFLNNIVNENAKEDWLNGRRTSLTTLYNQRRQEKKPIKPLLDLSLYDIRTHVQLDGQSQYRPFERNGRGQSYVAGSSLKGALRNAWLYHYLNNDPVRVKAVAERINQIFAEASNTDIREDAIKSRINAVINESYFRAGFEEGRQNENKQRSNIQADLFRAFKVSDSQPVSNAQMAAEDIRVLCDYRDYSYDAYGNLVMYEKTRLVEECVQENQSFEFSLGLNRQLLNFYQEIKVAPTSLTDWLDKADDFFRHVWKYEASFFSGQPELTNRLNGRDVVAPKIANFYRDKLPMSSSDSGWLLRVGAGSGLHSVTPLLRLLPDNEEEDLYLADSDGYSLEWQIGYFGFWRKEEKAKVFPKSRKVIWRNDYVMPLGWLWVTEVN